MARDPSSGIFYSIDAEARADRNAVKMLYLGQCKSLPEELASFTSVESLDLDGSKKLDWGSAIAVLAALPRLEVLRLGNCGLSSRRFPLGGLRSLELSKLVLGDPEYGYPGTNLFTTHEARALAKSLEGVDVVFPRFADELPDSTEFGSTLPEEAVRHITDPAIKKLYWHLHHDSYRALAYAERIRDSTSDRLAVLEAMGDALDRFCAELTELRGYEWSDEEILDEYGHQYAHVPPDELFERRRRVVSEIEAAQAGGSKSRIYPIYLRVRRRWENAIEEAADELVCEMTKDEGLEAELARAMSNHVSSAPQKLARDLARVKDIGVASPRFAAAAAAMTNNGIVALLNEKKIAPAKKIVQAWLAHCAELDPPGWLREELSGNALACGAAADEALRDRVIAELVPREVLDARLAFNLACVQAACGRKDLALHWVKVAIDLGREPNTFLDDADLASLRGDPTFESLVRAK